MCCLVVSSILNGYYLLEFSYYVKSMGQMIMHERCDSWIVHDGFWYELGM